MYPGTVGLETQVFLLREQVEALQRSDHTGTRALDLGTDFGFRGDGSDNSIAVSLLVSYLAAQAGADHAGDPHAVRCRIRVRPGTYVWPATDAGAALQFVEFEGTDRDTCIFQSSDPARWVRLSGFDHLSNLTIENFQRAAVACASELVYRNCVFRYNSTGSWGSVGLVNVSAESATVEDCAVQADSAYIGIWSSGGKNLRIRHCSVTGSFSHCIRVESIQPGGRIEIVGCDTDGGQTGIFLPANRSYPIENLLIEGNRVRNFAQEGISLDGMGNNAAMNSVIGDGTILAASNDAIGRLVITPSLVYRSLANTNDPLPISGRSDWANFYGVFTYGSGIPGSYAKVYAFDAGAGTLTLDTFTPAAAVTLGGGFGVHGGFWGAVIRDNHVHSLAAYGGTDYAYNVGISLWLDCFDSLVENNRIVGCANGITVAGGLLYGAIEALSFGNRIRKNRLVRCQQKPTTPNGQRGAIRIEQFYGGTNRIHYGNRARDNYVDGGEVWVAGQDDAAKVWDASNELVNGATLHAS